MKFNKLQKKSRQQKVTVLLSEVIKNKEATNEYFLGHSDKKIQALPKKEWESAINYVARFRHFES